MEKPRAITSEVMSADRAFRLEPCTSYVCTIAGNNGSGVARLQVWDGKAWLNHAASTASGSQVFEFTTPPTGRVNFDVSAGEVIVTCAVKAPTVIRNH